MNLSMEVRQSLQNLKKKGFIDKFKWEFVPGTNTSYTLGPGWKDYEKNYIPSNNSTVANPVSGMLNTLMKN